METDGSKTFSVRLPVELAADVEAKAKSESRSASNMIVVLLQEALAARRVAKK